MVEEDLAAYIRAVVCKEMIYQMESQIDDMIEQLEILNYVMDHSDCLQEMNESMVCR